MKKTLIGVALVLVCLGLSFVIKNKKPSSSFSKIEKIYDDLREDYGERIRSGAGGDFGAPPQVDDSDESWLTRFLPECQRRSIPMEECKIGTLKFKEELKVKSKAAEVEKALARAKAEEAEHAKAISLGYENDPRQIGLKALVNTKYGANKSIGTYLQEKIKNQKGAGFKIENLAGAGSATIELDDQEGGLYKWSLIQPNFDDLRKKDFKGQIVWVPTSEKSQQLFEDITGQKFINFNKIFECSSFEKFDLEEALKTLEGKGIKFSEGMPRHGYRVYYRSDLPDVVYADGSSVRSAEINLKCGFLFKAMNESLKNDFKEVFVAFLGVISPSVNAKNLYDACVKEAIETGFKDTNLNIRSSEFYFCEQLPGLKLEVAYCNKNERFPCLNGVSMSLSADGTLR